MLPTDNVRHFDAAAVSVIAEAVVLVDNLHFAFLLVFVCKHDRLQPVRLYQQKKQQQQQHPSTLARKQEDTISAEHCTLALHLFSVSLICLGASASSAAQSARAACIQSSTLLARLY